MFHICFPDAASFQTLYRRSCKNKNESNVRHAGQQRNRTQAYSSILLHAFICLFTVVSSCNICSCTAFAYAPKVDWKRNSFLFGMTQTRSATETPSPWLGPSSGNADPSSYNATGQPDPDTKQAGSAMRGVLTPVHRIVNNAITLMQILLFASTYLPHI